MNNVEMYPSDFATMQLRTEMIKPEIDTTNAKWVELTANTEWIGPEFNDEIQKLWEESAELEGEDATGIMSEVILRHFDYNPAIVGYRFNIKPDTFQFNNFELLVDGNDFADEVKTMFGGAA